MKGILPEEAHGLLTAGNIVHPEKAISDDVERVLLKLWLEQPLTTREKNLNITPAELAALWSITHKRPIDWRTTRQVLRRTGARGETLKEAKTWGEGKGTRRQYRLGDALPIRVQERMKTKERDQQ